MQVNQDYVYCHGCKWAGDVWRLVEALAPEGTVIGKFLQTTNFPSPSGRVYKTSSYVGPVNMNLIDYWHTSLLTRSYELTTLQAERLFNDETVRKFKLGYRPDKNAWVIPFIYRDQCEIVQFRSRKTNESGLKYWGLKGHQHGAVINQEILDSSLDYVVILLGAFDPLLAFQDGLPAVGLNGSMPFTRTDKERVQKIFSKQKLIFVVPDNNEHEYDSAKMLAEWLNAEVRYFPTELPHNVDYIDYRKAGKTAEDFKREVLGILPYEDIDNSLFENLCAVYDKGNKREFATVYCEMLARGVTWSDMSIPLANRHVTDVVSRRQLYNVKCKEDFIEAMGYQYIKRGGW
jgi:hypothetical protein